MQYSHSLDRLHTSFDEPHLIAHAGLLLPATLAQHLGLPELFNDHVDLGQSAGHAQVGRKAMTLIASLLAGGDCIEDAAALRAPAVPRCWAIPFRHRRPWAPSCAPSAGAMPNNWM